MSELKESKKRVLNFLRKNPDEEYMAKNIANELRANVFKTREAVDALVENGKVNSEIKDGRVYYSISEGITEKSRSKVEEKREPKESDEEAGEEEEFDMKEHTFIKDDDDSIVTF